MKSEVVNVTPKLAKEWLERNYDGNRKIRASYVSQLANVMRDGRFVAENGQTIVLGNDGTLYDGQHRLSAIVESGCAQRLMVVWIKDGKTAYKTIDNGTKRQASDFLDGMRNRNSCAAYGKVMTCIEWGVAPMMSCLQGRWDAGTNVDRSLIVSYCERNAERVQNDVNEACSMRRAMGCGSILAYSAFVGIVRYCGMDELLDEFINDFCSVASDSKTVTAVKQIIMRANLGGRKMTVKHTVGTLLDGYTHYVDMDGSTMINKQTKRLEQYSEYVNAKRTEKSLLAKGGVA